jgi:hypothetical protein
LRMALDTPVVDAGNATRFVREHRFDDAPFEVAEFIAHDWKLQFRSLNHARYQEINGQTARLLLEGERTYGRHREIDAIDPNRSSTRSMFTYLTMGNVVLGTPHWYDIDQSRLDASRLERGAGQFSVAIVHVARAAQA